MNHWQSALMIALALLAACGLGCEGEHHAAKPPDPAATEPHSLRPQPGGQSGVEGHHNVCGGEGTELELTAPLPALGGVTPEQLADRIAGSVPLNAQWRPWWLAPDAEQQDLRQYELELTWRGTARSWLCDGGATLDVTVQLKDADDRPVLSGDALLHASPSSVGAQAPDISFTLQADAPELAASLQLPEPAPSSDGPDRFVLDAVLSDDGWQGTLDSIRGHAWCALLRFPARPEQDCDRYDGFLSGGEPLERLELDDVVAPDVDQVTARDALAEFAPHESQPLYWSSGERTTVHFTLEPIGFACASSHPAIGPAPAEESPRFPELHELIVPVRARAQSEDGKLDLTVDAELSYYVTPDPDWNGWAGLYGMLTTSVQLEGQGAHIDMPRTGSGLELFSFRFDHNPGDPATRGTSELDGYAPFAGAPSFPEVAEVSSDRVSCFGAPEQVVTIGINRDPTVAAVPPMQR
jgi:hypothetical protein